MKPLVYWCRWHQAQLRLRGRDSEKVWGELVFTDKTELFSFDLHQWQLTRGEGASAQQVTLDEMGVVIVTDPE